MTDSRYSRSVDLPVDPDEAFSWHLRPGALTRLTPPWEKVVIEEEPALEEGARGVIRVQQGPLRLRWVARIRRVDREERVFVDDQESGPFARWSHEHRVAGIDGGSRLTDAIDYALPAGAPARWIAGGMVERKLDAMFAWRHRITRHDLALHARLGLAPKRIAMTGASGLVGRRLTALLRTGGHEVLRLVRREARRPDEVCWDPNGGFVDVAALEGVDAVVHLAGESVAGLRWTDAKKRRIEESRVLGSRTLVDALRSMERPPSVLVSASAIGWYGDRADEVLEENAGRGSGFLAETCEKWEHETGRAADAMRVVQLRLGVVLDPAGGALQAMLPSARLGLGGPLAGGQQWFSWVALDDVLGAFAHAIACEELSGPANLVAPDPVRQRDFARTLGRVLGRPAFAPAPRFAMRALLGREQADEMLLASARVTPAALQRTGFEFGWPEVEGALAHSLGRTR